MIYVTLYVVLGLISAAVFLEHTSRLTGYDSADVEFSIMAGIFWPLLWLFATLRFVVRQLAFLIRKLKNHE